MKTSKFIIISVLGVLLSTNSFAQKLKNYRKVQYDNLISKIDFQGTKSVSIAVLDHRVHVLKDGKPTDFVGYTRATVGIPYPLGTRTKMPLADDIAGSISGTLSNKGFKCSVISTTPTDSENDIVGKLKETGADRSLLFVLNSWSTDTYQYTLLTYDIQISMYERNGSQSVNKKFSENKKEIGKIAFGSSIHAHITEGFKNELGKILNDPDIKGSFQ